MIDVNHAINPGCLYDCVRGDLIWLPEHVETILAKYLSLTRDLARSAMTKLENAGNDFSGLV